MASKYKIIRVTIASTSGYWCVP